ncbi:MAG: TIGR03915 family putative DNA repair protein [Clostridiales Family XIII bacterium]|jgi:hypothetical protein|nr:TIGR03915 family putative DNA repair protein [Clostridiales Family XIII bacterium]
MNYLYDGSFDGFLCCIYAHYYTEKADGIFLESMYQQDMLTPHHIVAVDGDKAATVYSAIEKKISKHDIRRVYMVFCSSALGKEGLLLKYVRLGFRLGSKVGIMYGEPIVSEVLQIEKKVANEVHRMCGLIRFSEMRRSYGGAPGADADAGYAGADCGAARDGAAGACYAGAGPGYTSTDPGYAGTGRAAAPGSAPILYAPIEPDHDILEFLAPHFCDRYKEDPFIIHDRKRKKALFAAVGEWYITPFAAEGLLTATDPEASYRKLWKEYFGTVMIKERANPECQRRFMPARYWKNLTECQ